MEFSLGSSRYDTAIQETKYLRCYQKGWYLDSKSHMSSERENVKTRTEIPKLRGVWNKSRGLIKRMSQKPRERRFFKIKNGKLSL